MAISPQARRVTAIVVHGALWGAAFGTALLLRFDANVPSWVVANAARALPLLLLVRCVTFWHAGLFRSLLRYTGVADLLQLVRATAFGSVLFVASGLLVHRMALPRSIYVLEFILAVAVATAVRLAVRLRTAPRRGRVTADAPPAILLGAGNAGDLFLRDLERSSAPPVRVAAVLDDDPGKHGSSLHGITVHGGIARDELVRLMEDTAATRAILAMPTAPGVRTREILALCRSVGLSLKTLPSLQQIASGEVNLSSLRDVAIEDLLRRQPVELDQTLLNGFLRGRRVLVTGGAGSIGSELVRQIARFEPEAIALFDHNENALFFLERELRELFPALSVKLVVADVRDHNRVRQVFRDVRPSVVYHAAAHKHVPLMELNPDEAVRNNIIGTRVIADAAAAHGCEAFVLISTDKAVNPTSVMGTTKRIAEMYVQSLSSKYSTRFVAVRFGNVLGSAGSVVPIFRAQIAAGGPVCVTHPEMRRYFMTIPEACQLVLQAGAIAAGGEIFILDMGELVKIVDLARDMISLSGLRPDLDIEIEYTGMRPGEKLYEELMLDAEATTTTPHPKIRVAKIAQAEHEKMVQVVDSLERLVAQVADQGTVRAALSDIVPEATLQGRPAAPEVQAARPSAPQITQEAGAGLLARTM